MPVQLLRLPLFPYTTLFRSVFRTVSTIIGVSLPARNCLHVSRPPIPGMFKSSSTRSGNCSRNRSSASSPLRASTTSYPCPPRSEEHTSELQSRQYLVCRLLHASPTTATATLSLHDALPICIPHCQHDNRCFATRAQLSARLQASYSRHVQIQQHQVRQLLAKPFQRLFPAARLHDLIPLSAEIGRAHV